MAVTPHGVLPRDSHEIPPTIGGGTQVADFTRGFIRGKFTKHIRRRNGGGQGDPDPLMINPVWHRSYHSRGHVKGGDTQIADLL